MSYQVLARKYRPKAFTEMVGQEHVLRALINALNSKRLHHAYLFTGTRGVGKTTLARLLAKCLNCEVDVGSQPCEQCSSCLEINAGRFVDLIEVDAASRTRVEDTRELLDNVQYAPTRGRYKVYLIDEVHMLSGHSFNALLKTLEEPPPHIKFLLATTDPQRLPITVLSRCLQFNLKNLSPEKIAAQLENILQQEQLPFELPALQQLARAANGSLRDALSLLDQAIAYSNGAVNIADVSAMLGSIEKTYIFQLLEALLNKRATGLLAPIEQLAEQGAEFASALEELISLLHQLALAQVIPEAIDERFQQPEKIRQWAAQFSAEDIQLFYQIALIGRRDLPLAPSARIGFEMTLLRMLAFMPANSQAINEVAAMPQVQTNQQPPAISVSAPIQNPGPKTVQTAPPVPTENRVKRSDSITKIPDTTEEWIQLIPQLNLTGFTQALACNCAIESHIDGSLVLALDPAQSALHNPKQEVRLAEALSHFFNKPIKLQIRVGSTKLNTPARREQQHKSEQLQAAKEALQSDTTLQNLIQTFDAKLDLDSIQLKNPAMLGGDQKGPN